LDFLHKELKTARCVKDRQNRQNVISCLTKLIEHLRIHWMTKPRLEKGLSCFVAEDKNEGSILEVFEPANVNHRFIYDCGSKFNLDPIKDLFTENESKGEVPLGYLLLVSGDSTAIFDITNFKIITTISGRLAKRQKKGGQSSVRFSRIAEESRHSYIIRIADELKKLTPACKFVFLFGARELSHDLSDFLAKNHKDLFHSIVLDDTRWHSFENGFHFFVNQHRQEIKQIISQHILCEKTSGRLEETKRLLTSNSDYLLFGKQEILDNIDQLEWIIIISPVDCDETKFPQDKLVKCDKNSSCYTTFASYDFIGKLYYVVPANLME
jgi:peptide subunit release factor 1 (eRF1)